MCSITRSGPVFRLFICLACVGTPAVAQRSYNWRNAPPPLEVFAPVFGRIWAAAAEPETFRSIKSDVLFDRPGWSTNTVLPGAKESECWLRKDATNPKMPAYERSPEDRQGHYECSLNFRSTADATHACTALGKLVESSEHDWIVSPSVASKPALSRVQFFKKGEFSQFADETLGPGFIRYIALTVYPNQCSFDIWARWVPNFVEAILAKVADSGRYSTIPTPDTSPAPPGATDTVALSIVNSSSFAADVWFSGPDVRGKRILPASTWDFRVSPGLYRVVAQFAVTKEQLDAGVKPSSLVPVYGMQDFAVGTQYKYRLQKPSTVTGPLGLQTMASSANAPGRHPNESVDSEIAKVIGSITAPGGKPAEPAGAVRSADAINSEVTKIVDSGQYSKLPLPITTRYGNSDATYVAVNNETTYSLLILISGHTSQQYTIAPGESLDIMLVPGAYRIVGTVPAQEVVPFYGTGAFEGGSKYQYRFYIK